MAKGIPRATDKVAKGCIRFRRAVSSAPWSSEGPPVAAPPTSGGVAFEGRARPEEVVIVAIYQVAQRSKAASYVDGQRPDADGVLLRALPERGRALRCRRGESSALELDR